jgi:hypothetical protein
MLTQRAVREARNVDGGATVDVPPAMTVEPFSLTTALKAVGGAIAAIWKHGALLLWCITVAGAVVFAALIAGAHWKLGDTSVLLTNYGTVLGLGVLVGAVFACFATYSERAARLRNLSLIADELQSHSAHAKQPSGQTITHMTLRFQATNTSEGSIMLSAVRLRRPWVRRREVTQSFVIVRHPTENIYSKEFPIAAHSLTYGSVHIAIDHPVGRIGKDTRVVIGVQDHAGQWHKLVFPRLKMVGLPPK